MPPRQAPSNGSKTHAGNAESIRGFWNDHPCGEDTVADAFDGTETYFARYDAHRYREERHIPDCLDRFDWRGKRVLEIGLGHGAESEQLIRRGAIWSGLDLTSEACRRTRARLDLRSLPNVGITSGSACALPFRDQSFDMVFSHGVLHHIPDIDAAEAEIARVLKPGGRLVLMVYARHSLNYWVSIWMVRRVALALIYALGIKGSGKIARHLENARRVGLWRYLRMSVFIHRNTDGPLNPYARVYSRRELISVFRHFELLRCWKTHMHAPPLPVKWLHLGPMLGWHLWAELRRRAETCDPSP